VKLCHDLRVVGRDLLRAPGSTILIVLTLAIAIGANSATFSLIDRVALRPLPVAKPEQLVMVTVQPLPVSGPSFMMGGGKMMGISYPLFQSLRAGLSHLFSATALRRTWRFTLSGEPSAIEVIGEYVNSDYFRVLGLKALLGRTLNKMDDRQKDGTAVVVLNHGFWIRQFGGDPNIVTRTIRVNNIPLTVAGVLAPGYNGMIAGQRPELFFPLQMADRLSTFQGSASARLNWDAPGVSMYVAFGRLRAGVDRKQAERELRALYQSLLTDATRHVRLTPRDNQVYINNPPLLVPAGTVGSAQVGAPQSLEVPLRLLLGMTVFVLLIAAGNVANLLAARGALRRHDLAVCFALGACRWDVLRPRLVECVFLSALSGGAGLLFAAWMGDLVPTLLGVGNDLVGVDTKLDGRVVTFTTAVSLATGLVIWLASALAMTRRNALPSLARAASLQRGGRSAPGLHRLLVVVQLALSVALICASALLSRSLWNVLSTNPGFDAGQVMAFTVNPGTVGYRGDRLTRYSQALAEQAKALPGVSKVALTTTLPLSGGNSRFAVAGPRQQSGLAEAPYVNVVDVSPDFFATLGLPIIAGRPFDDRDGKAAAHTVIVNETLARLILTRPTAIGQMIGIENGAMDTQIVGVVRDARGRALNVAPEPTLFRPLAQAGGYGRVSVLLRTTSPNAISAAAVAELVGHLDPVVAITQFGGLSELAREMFLRERMLAGLSLVFAALSAIVAGLGLFGVTSFNVTRRTREFGIRLALGASRGDIERMILREVIWLVIVGEAIGLALYLAANRVLHSMVFQVSPNDPLTVGLAAATLAIIAMMAGLLPACRAANVNPAVSLRSE
jgi:predicted permease